MVRRPDDRRRGAPERRFAGDREGFQFGGCRYGRRGHALGRPVRYQLAKDFFFGNVYRIPEKLAGHGSGVIISPDGYALTSAHVVQGAEEIEAVLDSGEKLPAQLIGIDSATDLAVVKIQGGEGRTFDALPPGDSDALRVGEFVIALGSPFRA